MGGVRGSFRERGAVEFHQQNRRRRDTQVGRTAKVGKGLEK